jgi:alkanesulfonate monooxygenase SsuD/methylene tetrahydromethanopterin reductase-like flavin-dependent oxidoreductase (luciferase family)
MANHGTLDYSRRGKLLRERIEAMQAIWNEEKAEYHGEFVDFDPIFAWPKPVQRPRPPIHVGGGWPRAARRAARWGDGWIPVGDAEGVLRRLDQFRDLVREAGRDPAAVEVSLYFAPPERAILERLRDAGISRAILGVPAEPAERVLPLLDGYRALAEAIG